MTLNPLSRLIHNAHSCAVTRNKGITNDASEAASFLGLLTHVMKPREGSGIYSGLTPLRITADTHKMVGGTAIHNLTDPYSRHPMHVVRRL